MTNTCNLEENEQDFVRAETGADGRRYIVARVSRDSQSSERFTQMIIAEEQAKARILRFITGTRDEEPVEGTLSGILSQRCYSDGQNRVFVRLRMPDPR